MQSIIAASPFCRIVYISEDFVNFDISSNYFDVVAYAYNETDLARMIDRGDARAGMIIPPGYYGRDITAGERGQTKPIRLMDTPAEDGVPTWSPDGKWLAFLSNRDGAWAVWAIRPEQDQATYKLFDIGGSPEQDWMSVQMVWIP